MPLLLENSSYKHEDALASRIRLRGYLADLGESIERIDDRPAKESLQEQSMDLRRRVEDLAAPLDIAGSRLNRYAQRVAAGTPGVEPRTSGGTEERLISFRLVALPFRPTRTSLSAIRSNWKGVP